jgi:hypothetical protein
MANEFVMPHRGHQWNRAHLGAYRKGWNAFNDGVPLIECPYPDHRKPGGGLSWSRTFINAWRDGWRDARRRAQK